uniref:SFRICE_020052 n=1 Tax=Spodoptera frugiperda TaxID=7108 RepID=A0A2H1W372_SPOFR
MMMERCDAWPREVLADYCCTELPDLKQQCRVHTKNLSVQESNPLYAAGQPIDQALPTNRGVILASTMKY